MNKKLINGLLLLAVATSGASVFTSCKDNEDATLAGIYDNESELINALQKKLADLLKDTDDKLALKLDEATYNAFKNGEWATIWRDVEAAGGIKDQVGTLWGDVEAAGGLKDQAGQLRIDLDKLSKEINDPGGLLEKFNNLDRDWQQHLIEYAQTKLAVSTLESKVKALENSGYLNQADRKEIMDLIEANGTSIAALKSYMDAKLASMVTSIQVQRVYNNIYGSLDLPMGINSTVLGSYYYEAKEAVTFPNTDLTEFQKGEYKETNPDLLDGIRAWDEGIDPQGVVSLPANQKKIEETLGKIYLTVNPVGPDFSGLTVELKSSKENAPVKATLSLAEEGADDEEFKFGSGTRAKNNGLYVIKVPVSVEDIENIEVKVDQGLKSSLKDLYNNPSKADLTNVAQGVYNTLINTNLPAYAVKLGYVANPLDLATTLLTVKGATLGENGVVRDADGNIVYEGAQTNSLEKYTSQNPTNLTYNYLYSKYDLAAVTFHPLSFGTGVDLSFDRELPTFGRIKDAINDYFDDLKKKVKITINLGSDEWVINFDKDKFNVNIDNIEIDLTGVPVYKVIGQDENGNPITSDEVIGTVGNDSNPVKIILDKDGKTGEINGVRYASIKQLIDAINGPMDEVESVIDQVNSIVTDINEQLKNVNVDLNNQIQDILSDIQDDMNKKLDSNNDLVKLYNKIVDKVNGFLKDPNHYLQVYAAYKDSEGNLHHFSTDINDPSLYKGNAGVTVYMTSYNGELLAPAYKKIVTISNVYKKNGQGKLEEAPKSVLEKANSGEDINTVIDGYRHKVALTTLDKGYTYEIFYSALDYRGVTSSRKYYLEVK